MDQTDRLIHLLNDDNLDLIEYCKMCRFCVLSIASGRFEYGCYSHNFLEKINFCKIRQELYDREHN